MYAKKWYESKTLWIAILQGLAGVLLVLSGMYPTLGYIAVFKSIVDMVIRINTGSILR